MPKNGMDPRTMSIRHFSEELFERHPVWKWDAATEGHEPVDDYDPLPDDQGHLFVMASFEAPNGQRLSGYLVGYDFHHAFGLLVGDEAQTFNCHLPEFYEASFAKIFAALGTEPFDVWPLRYESEFGFAGSPPLKGVFELEEDGTFRCRPDC